MTTPTRPTVTRLLASVAVIAILATACSSPASDIAPLAAAASSSPDSMGDMGSMNDDAPRFPPVSGFYDGSEILFIHSETSDPEIADLLTTMMGASPVIVVERLADVPEDLLGKVYVFANGLQPDQGAMGPLGFQPDVFDSAPGDDAYTPLRHIVLVKWAADAEPRQLTSEREVLEALDGGDVTLEPTGKVVVMPFLTWPGGQR